MADKKFCSTCRKMCVPEGFKLVAVSSGMNRWKCAVCIDAKKRLSKSRTGCKPGPKPKPRQEIETPSEYEDQIDARQALGL